MHKKEERDCHWSGIDASFTDKIGQSHKHRCLWWCND